MRIAVWKTGHEIADTVANALREGFNGSIFHTQAEQAANGLPGVCGGCDVSIGYGILRGTADVFRNSPRWFNVDRGYFKPGHYDGYYRISYKGTQAKYDAAFPITRRYEGELQPKRRYDKSKPILACPMTPSVKEFFRDLDPYVFTSLPHAELYNKFDIRHKGDPSPIEWDKYGAVITFNSSIGWQALIRGIPCLSDPLHSVVGSYYNTKCIDEAVEMFHSKSRKPLLDFMASHQFTLAEIAKGSAWPLIQNYLRSPTIQSLSGLNLSFSKIRPTDVGNG